MSNFLQRAITGLFFVIVLVGSILYSQLSFIILFLIITVLGVWEFYGLAEKDRAYPNKISGVLASIILFLSVSYFSTTASHLQASILAINFPVLFLLFIMELYRKRNSPFTNIAYTLLGPLYIALPLALLNLIAYCGENKMEYTPTLIIGYFIILWTSDSGAYVVGSKFGKNRLFSRVSPKKSWEGTIGGGAFALLAGFINYKCFEQLSLVNWLMVALLIVVFGNLGDLVESLFKRSINVKDSGTILPGHGGILDRFDAVFISLPFVYAYLIFFA